MDGNNARSDALVLFGITGDLAFKMIFPALYAMTAHGELDTPVIGVASSPWSLDQLKARARESLAAAQVAVEDAVLQRLLARLRYVRGTYQEPATFAALKEALGGVRRPAFYLAIPPALFTTVIEGIGAAGLAEGARVIVEKPFGRDLASARELNRVARTVFPEDSIFRIDHFLGKEAIMNLLYFRFANSFLEPIWGREHIASVQVTLAEEFGIAGRGAFYESAGCLRDVIENHLFQIVALLAMEPPATRDYGAIHDEKAKVFARMRPLVPGDLVRGQYAGYRDEAGVAADSDVETFCALRLFIDSPRWQGVPWFLRSGKCLPRTADEVVVQLRRPATDLFADASPPAEGANYLRFRISPDAEIALAARVKHPGEGFVGEQRELSLVEEELGAERPYERLLVDAMRGDGALFTRQDSVEAAWAAVEPVLRDHPRVIPYPRGSWGPAEADALIAAEGRWRDPRPHRLDP